jgi:glutamate formiminotransferase/glutamate formiminotransferase/formiminotetrahydrofolate cyclodeaminase
LQRLAERIVTGALTPDFGPRRLHPTAGATLVAARPPLVAFNVDLAPPATLEIATDIAARIRDGGPEGLAKVRAIGLWLEHQQIAQVSTNVEDHRATPLAEVVAAVARHAEPLRAELVGLAPQAALDGFPEDLPVANRRTIENALAEK